jgi:hypothetical protein
MKLQVKKILLYEINVGRQGKEPRYLILMGKNRG